MPAGLLFSVDFRDVIYGRDREKAICKFCDTDFWGMDGNNGGKYTAESLTQKIISLWPDPEVPVFVVCTGGEPGLQVDTDLVESLHAA
ncbi:MAG TPA: hypothetical protein PK611_04110, partial [Saprospiraceae bacterium]|nr:hypothetical protein [Saprospiraceae bacterium]